jgi:hypothetical protein
MEASARLAMFLAGNCNNGISSYELHRCLAQRKTSSKQSRLVFLATVVAVMFFFSSETILAVQRPPYPIKADRPDAGHWVIISTTEKLR